MREIKFRAWDKMLCEMFEVYTLSKYEVYAIQQESEDMYKLNLSDCELMQYTGLKDKNGVEIYDGDIVNVATSRNIKWALENGYVGVVEYDNATLNIGVNAHEYCQYICGFICKALKDPNDNTEYCTGEMCQSQCEVIGNIYQNPELLESK